MFKVFRFSFLTALFLVVACSPDPSSSASLSPDKADIKSTYLVTAKEAFTKLSKDSTTLLIQVSKPEDFIEEHIPKAQQIWRTDYTNRHAYPYGGMRANREEMENLLRKLGLTKDRKLLIYDTKGAVDAFRFAWILNIYGYKNYQVINGGLSAWKLEGFPIDKGITEPAEPSKFELSQAFNAALYASLEEVQNGINDPNTIIIDTRERYEYLGQPFVSKGQLHQYKKGAFASGCIPGAVHMNWSDLSDLHGDHRIKSLKDINYNLKKLGIDRDKNIIVYCQSGSRSSHTAFVLKEILKYRDVKNYDGSWIEWTYHHTILNQVEIEQKTSREEFKHLYIELEQGLKSL